MCTEESHFDRMGHIVALYKSITFLDTVPFYSTISWVSALNGAADTFK